MKTYYDMLELPRSASADDIKRAFRREIAKYHPDKVQHLGQEFQEIAASKAAALTQAYKILSDPPSRADYDAQLDEHGVGAPAHAAAPPQSASAASGSAATEPAVHPGEPLREPPPGGGSAVFARDRAGAHDLVRRATVARFRQAIDLEFGACEQPPVPGFEVVCIPKPSFWKVRMPPRVLGRFVPHVDAAAVTESWSLAARMKKDTQRDLCVFLLGPSVAPAGELARAIAEQRRRPMLAGGALIMIPVNTGTWAAHVPTDAPAVVKLLLARLKSM